MASLPEAMVASSSTTVPLTDKSKEAPFQPSPQESTIYRIYSSVLELFSIWLGKAMEGMASLFDLIKLSFALRLKPNDNTKKIESIFFMLHVPYVI